MKAQPIWMIAVGNLLGLSCLLLGLSLVCVGAVGPLWLLAWAPMHLLTSLMVSVGLHRYFSHGAFKTTRFWHEFMNYYSVILLLGSPIAWATAHITHHVKSDSAEDPHFTRWTYLLWKRYNHVPMVRGRMKRLLADKSLVFVHRHSMVLWLVFAAVLLAVSWKLFVFGYGMALGSVHLIGGLHQVFSHKNGQPRDLPWLEYVLPASGEWMHATHHKQGGKRDLRTKPWHLDTGALFIKLIALKARQAPKLENQ